MGNKFLNWIVARGLSNLDGGDNPHPTPKLPGANIYQISENLNKGDAESVRDALSAQREYEKKAAPVKATTAVAAATLPLWGPYALHAGKVLLNPAAAKTALGGAVATTADLVGTAHGIKRNAELLNKWISGNFNYSDPVEFGLNFIPGYGLSKGVKAGANMLEKVNDFQKLKRAVQNIPSEVTKEPIIRVFANTGLGLGKNNPHALRTTSESVYRVTGQDQIDDIMSSGYIRPKPGAKVKGGHTNEVHFAQGGPNLFYYDKRPVIEIAANDIVDGQVGSFPKDKIKAIWQWSEDQNRYVNILDNTFPWVVNKNTGSTVYSGITLPGRKAKDFSEDVQLLQYYATHRPRVQRMNFMKEYPTGTMKPGGAEHLIFDAGNNVEKILNFDLATYRHLTPGHVLRSANTPEELNALIHSVQRSADFRNRHIFSTPVQPAIVRKSDGSYVGMFTQKKLTPLIPDPNNVTYPVEPLEQQIKSFLNRPVMQELYPVRGYNITDRNFDPRTLGPLDGHVQNWAYDENGVLWGIDLMKQGGKCKYETRK